MLDEPTHLSDTPQSPDQRRASLAHVGSATYVPERFLADGAMGNVWQLRNQATNQLVAGKESRLPNNPAERERVLEALHRESIILESLQDLNHPALPRFYGADLDRQPPMMIVELIPGEPLSQRIERGEPLSEHEIRSIIRHIGGAQAAMHTLPESVAQSLAQALGEIRPVNSLVYLDNKPGNIMATGDPIQPYRLIDLGTAEITHAEHFLPLEQRRSARHTYGTPPYADPNYAWHKELMPTADVYSFAATLLDFALPGGIPDHVTAYINSVLPNRSLHDPHRPWPLQELVKQTNLSAELQSLLYRSLSLNIGERPQDMRAFLGQLPVTTAFEIIEPEGNPFSALAEKGVDVDDLQDPHYGTEFVIKQRATEQKLLYRIDADGTVVLSEELTSLLPTQAQTAYASLIELRSPLGQAAVPDKATIAKTLRLIAEVADNEEQRAAFSRILGSVLGAIEPMPNSEPHPLIPALYEERMLFVRPVDILHALTSQRDPRGLGSLLPLYQLSGSSDFWGPLKTALQEQESHPLEVEVPQTIRGTVKELDENENPAIKKAFESYLNAVLADFTRVSDARTNPFNDLYNQNPTIELTYHTIASNSDAPVVANPRAEILFGLTDLLDPVTRPFFLRAVQSDHRLLGSSAVLDWLCRDMQQTRSESFEEQTLRQRYFDAIDLSRYALGMATYYSHRQLNNPDRCFTTQQVQSILAQLQTLIPAAVSMDREFSKFEGKFPEFEHYLVGKKFMRSYWSDPKYLSTSQTYAMMVEGIIRILVSDEQLSDKEDLVAPYVQARWSLLPEELAAIKMTNKEAQMKVISELELFTKCNLSTAVRRELEAKSEAFTSYIENLHDSGHTGEALLTQQYLMQLLSRPSPKRSSN